MAMAEKKAAKLVSAWLTWFRTQSVEALPGVRIDVLIRRTAAGVAEVFTLELTEVGMPQRPRELWACLALSLSGGSNPCLLSMPCLPAIHASHPCLPSLLLKPKRSPPCLEQLGFSMLGVETLPPIVFGALLRSWLTEPVLTLFIIR